MQAKDRSRFRKLLAETRNAESLPIRTRLTDEEVARFAANRYRFPGVEIKARLFRQYPHGDVASHVIGYIGRINTEDQEKLAELDVGGELPRHRLHRQGRPGGELPAGAARHHRLRAGRDRRRRARHPHALAHAGAGRQQRHADARHQAAGDRRSRLRRAPRRAGRDRALDRRRARLRLQARLRPEPVRRRHRPAELGRAEQFARPAAQQPRHRRRLSAGLDLQAVHGAGGAGDGQAPLQERHQRPGLFRVRRPALPRLQGRAATATSTCTSRSWCPPTPSTTSSPTTWASTPSPASWASSASARRAASTWRASRSACCPRRNGSRSASASPSSRSGTPARPSRSASARATTPTRRSRSRVALATLAANGDMYRPRLVSHIDNLRTGERRQIEPALAAAHRRSSPRTSSS